MNKSETITMNIMKQVMGDDYMMYLKLPLNVPEKRVDMGSISETTKDYDKGKGNRKSLIKGKEKSKVIEPVIINLISDDEEEDSIVDINNM